MKTIKCYFDGSCGPKNPGGYLGLGGYALEGNTTLFEFSNVESPHIDNTNNVAEYKALLFLLNKLEELGYCEEQIIIHGDSGLVINQLGIKQQKANLGKYIPIYVLCKEKLKLFKNIKFVFIDRKLNKRADYLSKKEVRS